jgi:pimeloyl-ACP methyl ester carboxylesterase
MDYDAQRSSLYQPYLSPSVFSETVLHLDPWVCAELSRLVYTPFEHHLEYNARLQSALQVAGLEWIEYFHDAGTLGFAVRHIPTGTVVLVFRGTEPDLADFATDALTWRTDWPTGGHVHHGFAQALDSVWPQIEHRLGEQLKTCVFTGHSLGAALATLAASRVQSPLARLVTIGSPAVGDAAFVQTLANTEAQRYVNCCDVICTLPPLALGFAHAGAMHYVDANGLNHPVLLSEAAMEQDQRSARVAYLRDTAWRHGSVVLRDLADHAPINYIRALLPRP